MAAVEAWTTAVGVILFFLDLGLRILTPPSRGQGWPFRLIMILVEVRVTVRVRVRVVRPPRLGLDDPADIGSPSAGKSDSLKIQAETVLVVGGSIISGGEEGRINRGERDWKKCDLKPPPETTGVPFLLVTGVAALEPPFMASASFIALPASLTLDSRSMENSYLRASSSGRSLVIRSNASCSGDVPAIIEMRSFSAAVVTFSTSRASLSGERANGGGEAAPDPPSMTQNAPLDRKLSRPAKMRFPAPSCFDGIVRTRSVVHSD